MNFLLAHDFRNCKVDPSPFIHQRAQSITFLFMSMELLLRVMILPSSQISQDNYIRFAAKYLGMLLISLAWKFTMLNRICIYVKENIYLILLIETK